MHKGLDPVWNVGVLEMHLFSKVKLWNNPE
jgi:hypothetical protein